MQSMHPRFALFSLLLISFLAPLPAAESVLKAGAAKRDITPREPVPMWGYGARKAALSDGMVDPLYANALVIHAGTNKLAIVGTDLGRSPSEASLQVIRRQILEKAGIQHSFIAGSHAHHGPVVELRDEEGRGKGSFDAAIRYVRQLEEALVEAILEADARAVPARLAAGSRRLEGFNKNRHTRFEPKPVDPNLSILKCEDTSGKPIALVVNFAAHPTMLPASVLKFSADFPGVLKQQIVRAWGGEAIFMQGASGDLSVNEGPNRGYQAFGEALAREVIELANTLKPAPVESPSLQVRENRFPFEARVNLRNPAVRAIYGMAFFPELVQTFADEYQEGIRPRLTVAVLNGTIGFVGLSGEVFSQHALRLRERARIPHLFFFGCANGYHQYFPTVEAVAEGGYGADSTVSPVAVGAGEYLMDQALIWIYQLLGKIQPTTPTI